MIKRLKSILTTRHINILSFFLFCACQLEQTKLSQPHFDVEELEHLQEQSVIQATILLESETCAYCHPRQAAEFEASTMRYGFSSPVFNALELALNQITETFEGSPRFAEGGVSEGFCSACHSPQATQEGLKVNSQHSSAQSIEVPERRGLTCETCHVPHPSFTVSQTLTPSPNFLKVGPSSPGIANPFHGLLRGEAGEQARQALRSGELCGSCHDVRPKQPDLISGEPHMRSEDLFSEWARSPWADPSHPQNPMRGRQGIIGLHEGKEDEGEQVTCNDCHMSLYPERGFDAVVRLQEDFPNVDPNTLKRKLDKLYAVGQAVDSSQLLFELDQAHKQDRSIATPEGELSPGLLKALMTQITQSRRISSHRFTGVSRPLNAFPMLPILPESKRPLNTAFALESDRQELHRRQKALLQAAISLQLDTQATSLQRGRNFTIDLWLENIGAGHHVPAGFSQERELWVELNVEDQGRSCQQDQDCEDLLEPRLFLDDPNHWCHPHTPSGIIDPSTPMNGSWELARRRERSAICSQAKRCILYRSGYLIDHDGDGRLNDEDLRHQLIELDPQDLKESCSQAGPDADLRLSGVERGLVHFTNSLQNIASHQDSTPIEHPRFMLLAPSSVPYQADGDEAWRQPIWRQPQENRRSLYPTEQARYERVRYLPNAENSLGLGPDTPTILYANRAFNGQALKPFEPRLARYEIPWREGIIGPIKVTARAQFRFFSPRLLRALAQRDPELLTEQMIDEHLNIVEMASKDHTFEFITE